MLNLGFCDRLQGFQIALISFKNCVSRPFTFNAYINPINESIWVIVLPCLEGVLLVYADL